MIFVPLSGAEGSEYRSTNKSFPTLRHLQPKFPVVLVGSLRGKASTLVVLFLEKICFVEHCDNQKAPLQAPQSINVCALLIVPSRPNVARSHSSEALALR